MSAMAVVSGDHDAAGVRAGGLHQAGDQLGGDAGDIAGRQQHADGPRIGVEHCEAKLDRVAHFGGLDFGNQHLGPGLGGLGGDRGSLWRIRRCHEDDPLGTTLAQGRHDVMDERLPLEFHEELGPAHAHAPAGGGQNGGDHGVLAALGAEAGSEGSAWFRGAMAAGPGCASRSARPRC